MCNTAISFKWLDILEKEFDKAFVHIDFMLSELDGDEAEVILHVRKKIATMCSCFSQLSHKAMTIFQINAKTEAELVNLRSEIVEMKMHNQLLEKEVHALLLQLHAKQLEELNLTYSEQKEHIKDRLQRDLAQCSPLRTPHNDLEKAVITLENWKKRLQAENELLRCTIVNLQAEVCGSRLAAKYLDKELAGRIQQLQLLSRDDMNIEVKNKLWDQLDAEILLQRHKTVINVMRQQKSHSSPPDEIAGRVRNVYLNREPSKGLGISVTGGREHGVPIIISELEPWCSEKKLYVGDAILSVNGIDLNQLTHKDAVKVLSSQIGNVNLTVITLSTINLNEIEEESNFPSYLSYPFFENCNHEAPPYYSRNHNRSSATPTAPRTPPSCSDSPKSSPEHNSRILNANVSSKPTPDEMSPVVSSETELFGITTLQKIFRTVSAIESSPKSKPAAGAERSSSSSVSCDTWSSNGAAVVSPVAVRSCCEANAGEDGPSTRNVDVQQVSGSGSCSKMTTTNLRTTRRMSTSASATTFNSSVPVDQIDHAITIVSGLGDSNVGTPV